MLGPKELADIAEIVTLDRMTDEEFSEFRATWANIEGGLLWAAQQGGRSYHLPETPFKTLYVSRLKIAGHEITYTTLGTPVVIW